MNTLQILWDNDLLGSLVVIFITCSIVVVIANIIEKYTYPEHISQKLRKMNTLCCGTNAEEDSITEITEGKFHGICTRCHDWSELE